ncbi:hypothetical protein PV10_03473 [Exophiala mesophila]|uniref:ATP synthase mitochondrial F1 complex assembly factor 2 n=1 Tax=Exophiala mesophila TaxID=212818 RepID=A0A0D1Y599_EXOME|nr:uncharacterized protein PV10_03473 [Exophiala mesophila]KIV95871.1 hypothetical protein PV10_03473 [Exophiala mesophila]
MRRTAVRTGSTAIRASYSRCSSGQPVSTIQPSPFRPISTTSNVKATALPITGAGPPPSAPVPQPSSYSDRISERKRKADLLEKGKEIRASEQASSSSGKKTNPLKRRFWKDVHVKESPDGSAYHIYLDTRPVRTPNRSLLSIPRTKPHLAHAIAIEWDLLESAQQALKNHFIPMTSIAARAQDISEAEAGGSRNSADRAEIVKVMMRYLDTDTLLCWAPAHHSHDAALVEQHENRVESLRDIQIRIAKPIIGHLNATIWPGVEIKPVLDEGSIMPIQQSDVTRSVIQGWISGLPPYELAALERAVLAGKSLLIGARLLVEWSEEFRDLQRSTESRFGIEEAAEASSLEVKWQTGMWGEVEDTHDVENEDLRRQLGSAILLVSGIK